MPRSGTGTYSLPAANPVVTGTQITTSWANPTMADIAAELTNSLPRDGQAPPTNNLMMGGFKLTGLGNATARDHATNLGQIADGAFQYLIGVSGSDNISASLSPAPSNYAAGQVFYFTAASTNTTASPTLNINGLGAKPILCDAQSPQIGAISAGSLVPVFYDGTSFRVIPSSAKTLGIDDFGSYFSGTSQEAANQEIGRDLRGRMRDIRTFPGIVADGSTDDLTAFQNACVSARAGNYGIWFPEGVYCKLQFTSTLGSNSQVFISGGVSIKGANRKNCGFKIGKTGNHTPGTHWPLFALGITSKGSAVDSWSGTFDGVGFLLVAGCGTFERCIHIYEGSDFSITNCYADFRATTFTLGQFAGGWISSNVQPAWATGQTAAWRRAKIWGNTGFASCYYQNNESIGLTNLYDSSIMGNYVEGWSDDIACHGGANITVAYNTNKTVAGRYYAEDVTDYVLIGNHHERCIDPSGSFAVLASSGAIRLSHTAIGVVNNSAPANNNITIKGNRIVMPQNCYLSLPIDCENVQDGLIISFNTLENQGTGTLDAATGAISVRQTATLGAWVGPAGNPDSGTGGIVRCRNVQIFGNLCVGTGWSNLEGNCGINFSSGSAAIGPFEVHDNILGAYFMPYGQINFYQSNRILAPNSAGFTNVSVLALMRCLAPEHHMVLTAGMNLNFAGHPVGSPATLTNDGGLDFFPNHAGSVRGLRIRVASAAVASNLCHIRLLKNGVALGSDVALATITPATNFVSYTANFFAIDTSFAAQDKITVQMYFDSAQTVAITGTADLLVLYNGA